MAQIYEFEMKVAGREQGIQAFISTPLLTAEMGETEVIRDENANRIILVDVRGSCDKKLTQLINELAHVSKDLNLVMEAYSDNNVEQTQEHILLDRGQIIDVTQESYREYLVHALEEKDLEELLFGEGLHREELLERADEHGVYRTGGMEEYGNFQPLAEYLETEPRVFLEYTDYFGDTIYVTPAINMYVENDNLYLGLGAFIQECQMMDHYADVTVNVGALPYLYSAIDTNNNGQNVIDFLQEHGIAEPTGQMIPSGFCLFPVCRFNEDKLRELDPDGFADYAKAHGRDIQEKKQSLEAQLKEAEQRQQGQKMETSRGRENQGIDI